MNTILPMLVIILINPSELPTLIDLKHHANKTLEIFASGLDSNVSIRSNKVIGVAADPHLFENRACRGRDYSLEGDR
jgi:hypothetical protein